MNDTNANRYELQPGAPHPATSSALQYLLGLGATELSKLRESFASCAIENNRDAEILLGTLTRMLNNDKMGDRYVLGLAWYVRYILER